MKAFWAVDRVDALKSFSVLSPGLQVSLAALPNEARCTVILLSFPKCWVPYVCRMLKALQIPVAQIGTRHCIHFGVNRWLPHIYFKILIFEFKWQELRRATERLKKKELQASLNKEFTMHQCDNCCWVCDGRRRPSPTPRRCSAKVWRWSKHVWGVTWLLWVGGAFSQVMSGKWRGKHGLVGFLSSDYLQCILLWQWVV